MIENVRRRATRQSPTLRNMSHEGRLGKLDLPTLAYRRILKQNTKRNIRWWCVRTCKSWVKAQGRGHSKKFYERRSRLDKRKSAFCNRMVNTWNSLPEEVVNAESVKTFEKKLDKIWKQQRIKYDYKATIEINQHGQHPELNTVNLELESQAWKGLPVVIWNL